MGLRPGGLGPGGGIAGTATCAGGAHEPELRIEAPGAGLRPQVADSSKNCLLFQYVVRHNNFCRATYRHDGVGPVCLLVNPVRRVVSGVFYVLLMAILGYELWVIFHMITSHFRGRT
jgi:hypothetical protein